MKYVRFMVHPYSSIDSVNTWKQSGFILLDRSDVLMIDNQSIAVYSFAGRILTVAETLLPRYVNLFTNFRGPLFRVEMAPYRELHKKATSYFEQIFEATPHETTPVRTLISHLKNMQVKLTRRAGLCWGSKDEVISDNLRWNSTHGRTSVGRPASTYLHQLCADTGCSLEDLPKAMDDRNG